MVELTLYQQTMTFVYSLAAGVVIALVYIVMELFRELSPPGMVWTVAEDILFMGIAAGINLFLALSRTQGYIRFYVLASELAVLLAIYLTLGKFLRKILRQLIGIVKRGVDAIGSPIRRKCSRFLEKLSKKGRRLLEKVKKIKN